MTYRATIKCAGCRSLVDELGGIAPSTSISFSFGSPPLAGPCPDCGKKCSLLLEWEDETASKTPNHLDEQKPDDVEG